MTRPPVVIVGAGLTGLTTALLLARAGHRVVVLERDPGPPPATAEDSWGSWARPGVSQFRHPHLMLPRWHATIRRELPALLTDLVGSGARPTNLLHLQPTTITHGWSPGDEDFDTVAVRRPVLEACLARLTDAEAGVTVRRGVRVTGLLAAATRERGTPHVTGVETTDGSLAAGLVVDAGGRRTTLPRHVRTLGAVAPAERRDDCGLVYWSRHFRSLDGRPPSGTGAALTHHASLSVLTLPGDGDTFCVALATRADDRAMRGLRDAAIWEAVAATSPAARAWVERGEPTSQVVPIAGIEDVTRSYVVDGEPVVTGLVAVGDAAVATNPSLGRGASIGVLQACALRDVLAGHDPAAPSTVAEVARATAETVGPWVDATEWFDHHRLAEMGAEMRSEEYVTDDIGWAMSRALRRGAAADPTLARASGRIGGMLALPAAVLGDPAVGPRLGPWLTDGGLLDGPSRSELVAAASRAPAGLGV